ncbi:SDR family oxidoreductase [Rubrivirga sp. IMCC45206]|uniref:SDR family oxidoreductase n=1 Tax=Rubrivirga sp. IMCC45206 TaxID=3391614 RepID=UPI003990095F
MPRPLSDQIVVITGASSGAGLATAQAFAKEGASVVMAARNADELERWAGAIRADGGEALAVPTDVTDREQVEALAAAAVEAYGRIDTWVNNAGVTAYAAVAEQPHQDIAQIMATNFMGQVHGAQVALPHLEATGGALICTSSVLGDLSVPYQAAYCASKHAVVGFMNALRIELAKADSTVRLTVVKPSSMNTPLFEKAKTQLGAEPQPLGPTYEPEVYAEVILRAASGDEREAYVGGAGKGAALAMRFSPTLVGAQLGSPLAAGPASDVPKSADAPHNLYAPTASDGGIRGRWTDRAHASSAYQTVAGHSTLAAVAGGAALGTGAVLAGGRDRGLGIVLGLGALALAGKALTSLLADG